MAGYLSHGEIHTQYISLRQTLEYMLDNAGGIRDFFAGSGSGDIVFVGCGSSYWMSLSAHRTMKLKTGRRSYAVKAGDAVLCPDEYAGMFDNPTFIFPSRSGRTRETLDAVDIMKAAYPGAKTFSIVEYAENGLESKSDMTLRIGWANEESVCQTRSFSNMYAACTVLAAIIGRDDAYIGNLRKYLDDAPDLYRRHEIFIKSIADPSAVGTVVSLGAGLQYGAVVEGAYIVIEMAEFAANYYQLLEYRHGPIVTADDKTAVFICAGASEPHEEKMAREIRDAGAKVYAVASRPASWANHTFSLDGVRDKEILALHFAFVMQSFAHHFSVARGKNPDSPGNLVPFIVY
jgi:fructoselysine-6-P-deglycase FrlB-like protein